MTMTGLAQGHSRRAKESHRDTVTYEIDMLKYCFDRWQSAPIDDEMYRDFCLEGYLLHYRNLVRFFSGNHHDRDDLSMAKPGAWAGHHVTDAETRPFKASGMELERRYYDDISGYLHHCTLRRATTERNWHPEVMHREIMAILEAFQVAFPPASIDLGAKK